MCYSKSFIQLLGNISRRGKRFPFQNFQRQVFKIFKMFKKKVQFTRVVIWINFEISNRGNSPTLIKFLCCHYCWPLLCCSYWGSFRYTYADMKIYQYFRLHIICRRFRIVIYFTFLRYINPRYMKCLFTKIQKQ